MVSVQPARASGVWSTLGLPDLSGAPSGFAPDASDALIVRLRETRQRQAYGAARRPAESDEESDPGGAALRSAWLGERGLRQALRAAATARGEPTPLTPTSRPAAPLCVSPRRGFLAEEEDNVARSPMRSARGGPRQRSDGMSPTSPSPASPSAPLFKSAALQRTPGSAGAAELVDAVRRAAWQLRRLHAATSAPGHSDEAAAQIVGGARCAPVSGDEAWRESLAAMRAPLGEIANAAEAAVDPLYRQGAMGGGFGVRADDALYPLEMLLQAVGNLRDKVAAAAAGVCNFFGGADLSKYVSDCGQLQHFIERIFALVKELAAASGSEPPLRRDSALALIAELVPCPSSRRFWVAHFGVEASEADTGMLREAVLQHLTDAQPGASTALSDGLARTLDPLGRGGVTLCEFALLFGEVPLYDALDALLRTPDMTYDAMMSSAPFAWDPPRRRGALYPRRRGNRAEPARQGEAQFAALSVSDEADAGGGGRSLPLSPQAAAAAERGEDPRDLVQQLAQARGEVDSLRAELAKQRELAQQQLQQREEDKRWEPPPPEAEKDGAGAQLVAAAASSPERHHAAAAAAPPAEAEPPPPRQAAVRVDVSALLRQAGREARRDRGFARWLRQNCDGDGVQQLLQAARREEQLREQVQERERAQAAGGRRRPAQRPPPGAAARGARRSPAL
eukprot:TRINITY_DN37173_c0_g1_i1.p1 TRINITY_DN37173_c0_g1~~TRINITY_DN37173_c0_g1_i1.p1  ORF type:complete len:703 (+),score=233.73 TRINITY_DN37173_c0_g1_i1:72-2111(+)